MRICLIPAARTALISALAAIALLLTPQAVHAQAMTGITATTINAGSGPVTGTLCFTAVNQYSNPISISKTGGGFFVAGQPFCQTLAGGALSGALLVPNTVTDSAPGHGYDVTVYNTASGIRTDLGVVYGVGGSTWSLDTYQPPSTVPTTAAFTFTNGSGSAPSTCVAPAIDVRVNAGQATESVCSGGVFLPITGATGGVQIAGDLGGTVTAPVVTGLQGHPVSTTAPANGQALVWNGSQYAPTTPAASGGSSTAYAGAERAYGDSITWGAEMGAPSDTNDVALRCGVSYSALLASNFGLAPLCSTSTGTPVSMLAIPGDTAADVFSRQIALTTGTKPSLATRSVATMALGTNDVAYGPGTGYAATFGALMKAAVAWVSTPTQTSVLAGATGFTCSGTVVNPFPTGQPTYGGSTGSGLTPTASATSCNGNASISQVTYGNPIYIFYLVGTSLSGSCSVAVDSVSQGTISSALSIISNNAPTNATVAMLRVPVLASQLGAPHTVAITGCTGSTGILGTSTYPSAQYANRPTVAVADVFPQNQSYTPVLAESIYISYRAALSTAMAQLAQDGGDVRYVPVETYVVPTDTSNYAADATGPSGANSDVHFSQTGHNRVFQAFYNALTPVLPVVSVASSSTPYPITLTTIGSCTGASLSGPSTAQVLNIPSWAGCGSSGPITQEWALNDGTGTTAVSNPAGNNLTLTGVSWAASSGFTGSVANFSPGSNSIASSANSTGLAFDGTVSFTAYCWVKPNGGGGYDQYFINDISGNWWGEELQGGYPHVHMGGKDFMSTTGISTSNPTLLGFSYDGGGGVTMYANSSVVPTTSSSGSSVGTLTNNATLNIGALGSGSGTFSGVVAFCHTVTPSIGSGQWATIYSAGPL